jgi:Ca2+-binding EF-hand superfamily protein
MQRALFTALLLSSMAGLADAQTDRYPPDRVFAYYDRDKNGRLDGGEYERFSSDLKEAVRAVRLDFRRGVDQATFMKAWPRITGEIRARRDRDASRRDDRGGDSRSSSSYQRPSAPRKEEKSKSSSKRPPKRKERARVTVDLPTRFSEVDKNRDGQIGLYEWDRAKFREFFELDRNGDGLLTPRELSANPGASPAPRTTASRTASPSSPAAAAPASSPEPAGSGTITAVEFDPESSDGRRASYVFRSLDRNKDGSLTKEEWEKSQSTRRDFEKKNLTPPLPANLEQFAGLYIALRKAR